MIEAFEEHGGNHIAVAPVPEDQTHQYGIVGVEDRNAKVSRITGMVEKPPKGKAPSNLHISGRYIRLPYHGTKGHKTLGNWYTTLLNAHGNPLEHYGDLDVEMLRKMLDQEGAIKQFLA